MKIVALAGGVGGAKLADGLAQILPPENLTVVVNTGDDFIYLGLQISPDLDTVCYTLAGLANPETGWGRSEETFNMLENLQILGGPNWFRLGDRDLATHVERTRRVREGQSLSQITREFCRAWGVNQSILPMSDLPVSTLVVTNRDGELAFQEYFVHRKCVPEVKGFRFAGIELALPAPGVLLAINKADAIVICPSNPWVSIDTILAVPGIRSAVVSKPVVAVSPIINGQTVKGPAAKMFSELGLQPSALSVARHYGNILSGFILDERDSDLLKSFAVPTWVTNILMINQDDRRRLAQDVLNFINTL
jgi:LPPG:FO 2-phospho-L-lactate transferase